jgi:Rho-binding antiterminator
MSGHYQPISCINHERLEFAALKRQWLDIEIPVGETRVLRRLLPLDVYARDGVEWLEARAESGETTTVRLDQIRF